MKTTCIALWANSREAHDSERCRGEGERQTRSARRAPRLRRWDRTHEWQIQALSSGLGFEPNVGCTAGSLPAPSSAWRRARAHVGAWRRGS